MRKVVIFVCIYLVINSLILVLAKLFSKMQLVNEQRPVLMLVSGLLSVIFTWYIVTESNNNLEKELDRIDSEEDKERITRLINKGQLGCLVSLAIVVVFTAASVISGYYAVAVLILSLGYLAAIYLMRNNMRVYNDKIKKILKKQRVDDEIREESQEAETQATDSPYCSQLDGKKTGAVSEDYSEDKVFDSNGTIKISEQVFCELKSTIIAMLRLVKSVCSNSEYLQTMRRMSNTDGRACDYWFNIKMLSAAIKKWAILLQLALTRRKASAYMSLSCCWPMRTKPTTTHIKICMMTSSLIQSRTKWLGTGI